MFKLSADSRVELALTIFSYTFSWGILFLDFIGINYSIFIGDRFYCLSHHPSQLSIPLMVWATAKHLAINNRQTNGL